MPDVTTTLKDAAYVTVGLGVLGFQKAQVRRVELMKQLADQRKVLEAQLNEVGNLAGSQVTGTTAVVKELAKDLDARLVPVRQQVEERIDALEERLPDQAREIVRQARTTAKETQAQLRSRLGLATPATTTAATAGI